MKLFFVLLALMSAGVISAQKTIIHDANVEVRSLSGSFSAIKVSGGVDVYLSPGDKEALAVSASDAQFRDKIRTEVQNGVLNISYDYEAHKLNSGSKRLKVYVSFVTLSRLDASGASDIRVEGAIKGDGLTLTLSGASDFKGVVEVKQLDVDQRGASDVTISGKVGNLEIKASGASDLKGFDLTTDVCSAKAYGASDIKITVNKELQVEASGASSVQYKGSAVITSTKTNGASSVNKKG